MRVMVWLNESMLQITDQSRLLHIQLMIFQYIQLVFSNAMKMDMQDIILDTSINVGNSNNYGVIVAIQTNHRDDWGNPTEWKPRFELLKMEVGRALISLVTYPTTVPVHVFADLTIRLEANS